jgi:hypothetical protein
MAEVYQLVIGGVDGGGNLWNNVMHYRTDAAPTGTPFDNAADLINKWILANESNLLAIQAADGGIDFYSARKASIGGGPTALRTSHSAGTVTGPSDSAGLAANLRLIASTAPPRGNGHFYVGDIPSGLYVNDAWDPTYANDVATFANTLIAPFASGTTGGQWTPVIFPRPATGPSFDIDGVFLHPRAALMGRRTRPLI